MNDPLQHVIFSKFVSILSVRRLYFILRYLKVSRRGAENNFGFSRVGVMSWQIRTEVREEHHFLTCHGSQDLDSHYPNFPKVMNPLGFLCSPKKVLRFDIQDTCCKTQGSKLCWADFALCSLWDRSHPTEMWIIFMPLYIMAGSRAILGQFQQLEDVWEKCASVLARAMRQRQCGCSLCMRCRATVVRWVAQLNQGGTAESGALSVCTFFHARFLIVPEPVFNDLVTYCWKNKDSHFPQSSLPVFVASVLLSETPVSFTWQTVLFNVQRMECVVDWRRPQQKNPTLFSCPTVYTEEITRTQIWRENYSYGFFGESTSILSSPG